jgi:hypothetical protein
MRKARHERLLLTRTARAHGSIVWSRHGGMQLQALGRWAVEAGAVERTRGAVAASAALRGGSCRG